MCGKTASDAVIDYMLSRTKQAEDAINPACRSRQARGPAGDERRRPAGR